MGKKDLRAVDDERIQGRILEVSNNLLMVTVESEKQCAEIAHDFGYTENEIKNLVFSMTASKLILKK